MHDGIEEIHFAALEALCMFMNHDDHNKLKTAHDAMVEILVTELGMIREKIKQSMQIMDELCAHWVDSEEINTQLFDESEEQSDAPPTQLRVADVVDNDIIRLLKAAGLGELSLISWYIDRDTKWRKTIIPPLNNRERNFHRAGFLHRVAEREHVTLMHNSMISYLVPSALVLNYPWCIGYHCYTTSTDSLVDAYSAFCGNKVVLGVNSIVNAIHKNIHVPSDDDLRATQVNEDPTKIPNEQIRASDLYKSLMPNREVLPSLEELRGRLGSERVDRILHKCRELPILPDNRSVEQYLMSHRGCHMIIPGLWLALRSLCGNPHLFDVLVTKLEKFLKGKIVDDDDNVVEEEEVVAAAAAERTEGTVVDDDNNAETATAAEGTEGTVDDDNNAEAEGTEGTVVDDGNNAEATAEGTEDTVDDDNNVEAEGTEGTVVHVNGSVLEAEGTNVNKEPSVSSSNFRKYEQIRKNAHGDVNRQVCDMEEYLNNGDKSTNGHSVMKMLRGQIPGALTEKESRDNVFLSTNFFRSVASQMTKYDRFVYYRASPATEHGRYMGCAAVSSAYIRKVGGIALGGCHNTQGHDDIIRVVIPVPMFKNHIIEHGDGPFPITKMVCMITMNDYCRSALEVHKFQFARDLSKYD